MLVQKVCPKCGSKRIMGFIARPCFLSVKFDNVANKNVFESLEEDNNPNRIQYDTIKCADCGEKIKPNMLKMDTVKCKSCGQEVPASYVNDEGICYTCVAMKDAPDIASMSKEELLMLVMRSRMNQNTVQAEPQPVQDAQEDDANDDRPKRKRTVRRKSAKTGDDMNDDTGESEQEESDDAQQGEEPLMNPPESVAADDDNDPF